MQDVRKNANDSDNSISLRSSLLFYHTAARSAVKNFTSLNPVHSYTFTEFKSRLYFVKHYQVRLATGKVITEINRLYVFMTRSAVNTSTPFLNTIMRCYIRTK